jgi:methylated-DNA-[protein]-cysteine S-methyltransferase
MRLISRPIESPVGVLRCAVVLGADEPPALCLLEFDHRRALPRERRDLERHFACTIEDDPAGRASRLPDADDLIDRVRAELDGYFAGSLRAFTLPLALVGTDFQRRVWDELLRIPYGETRSYGQLAETIGSPGGARAVGMANGANRIAIVVPCHRVIESSGGLRGYGGGLDRKRFLLDLEQRTSGNGTLWQSYRVTAAR